MLCDGDMALLGVGRYDNLCEQLGGKPTPCVGFGCGLERLIAAAESRGIAFENPAPKVFVAAQCDGARETCVKTVKSLRDMGVSAECDLMGKSLKAQFKYADRQGFTYVMTIGESELISHEYSVKNMKSGEVIKVTDTTLSVIKDL